MMMNDLVADTNATDRTSRPIFLLIHTCTAVTALML